ncbi:hypothetical protein T12_15813 [Trichinella patagoniensis]|uniref:Uncharacterized protein n=1 Tax=Trichinella patagoniensis TaxID=990121 RepID=A0A0V0Z606_9BILA|nr:hypothetical protein T12_15813 [Trichinella patagoniensis]
MPANHRLDSYLGVWRQRVGVRKAPFGAQDRPLLRQKDGISNSKTITLITSVCSDLLTSFPLHGSHSRQAEQQWRLKFYIIMCS